MLWREAYEEVKSKRLRVTEMVRYRGGLRLNVVDRAGRVRTLRVNKDEFEEREEET